MAGRRAIGVLVALCISAAGIGYLYLSTHADMRPIDETTYCPTDAKGPNSVTAVLIDRTDNFNLTQQAAIRDRLNDLKDRTSRFDLIEIYAVEPTEKKLLQPEFSMCNPGRGEGISKWTGNPQLVEEHWKTLFATPLQHIFDTVLNGEAAAVSPIMESVQSIVVTKLGSQELASKKTPRRLIIISDLMQYVNDYTQYQPFTKFSQFKRLPYYQSVRADLSGISIEIWYIRREKTLKLQGEKHIDFWRDYFTDQGGEVDKVWDVPGT